jgi:TRAP-type C4-dicarboxylate transport system permease small subunit
MVAAAFLPWAWIERSSGHIMVELFTQSASKRFNEWLDIVVKIVTIAYVSLFTWQTGLRAIEQTRAGEVWDAAGRFIPVWPSRWMLPIAGGLMVVYLVLRVVSDAAHAVRRT